MPRFELGSLDSKSKVLTLTPHRLSFLDGNSNPTFPILPKTNKIKKEKKNGKSK